MRRSHAPWSGGGEEPKAPFVEAGQPPLEPGLELWFEGAALSLGTSSRTRRKSQLGLTDRSPRLLSFVFGPHIVQSQQPPTVSGDFSAVKAVHAAGLCETAERSRWCHCQREGPQAIEK